MNIQKEAVHTILNELTTHFSKEETVIEERKRSEVDGEEEEDRLSRRKEEEDLKGLLLALSTIVGEKLLEKSLSISSKRHSIIEYRSNITNRSMFKVKGDTGTEYKVLLIGYCNCKHFLSERAGTSMPICKHILATHIAKAQNIIETVYLTEEDWGKTVW